MKKTICLFILLLLSTASFAVIKLHELPMASDFHLGLVSGVGTGLNFGAIFRFPFNNTMQIGAELEPLMTDVNYSATMNAIRFGGVVSYLINDETMLNGHIGMYNLKTNQDFNYVKDGTLYTFAAATNYKGTYLAISLDYYYEPWGVKFSPKYVFNTVSDFNLQFNEIDFNITKPL
ncbi:MAG: hypothetical protein KKC80_06265 [Candidatus Margulisbacteria bacterium]|nr:hypothetical protein [Candidatus Margulisiibacteriota bacterium]MBU1617379.1 hypothetical protein [Candidatus Margulisiibacteriota bacterium]MBU1867446.1 hypothetical protein [Candidatus Margulisiibacteriota bacterium]